MTLIKAGFTITFKGNGKTMLFKELYHKFKSRIINFIEELLKTKNMKVKFRLQITYLTQVPEC